MGDASTTTASDQTMPSICAQTLVSRARFRLCGCSMLALVPMSELLGDHGYLDSLRKRVYGILAPGWHREAMPKPRQSLAPSTALLCIPDRDAPRARVIDIEGRECTPM
jgi:hypothetical protein